VFTMLDNLRDELLREKHNTKHYLEILVKWRRERFLHGIMEEHEDFPSRRRINNDEEIVIISEILESALRVREWGLFARPPKLY